ncbi:Chorismate mutase 2 [Acorus gramineus]|uniref:chorismate mutase n=1 Tax=Acorus gramineus TaxID=55184 RepID=A0AAV9BHH5_ACOGR|nr:Chorismate mutase 2 [Acorus gramineus]
MATMDTEKKDEPWSSGNQDSTGGITLQTVRDSLIRQEDTIVFSLIERSRFPLNHPAYNDASMASGSLAESVIREIEAVYAKAGLYENPEEFPFFPEGLPLPASSPPKNKTALSRRIHYGKFVAEVKYRDAPEDYEPAIRAQDRNALMKLLTFESVEEMVKKRVEKKAMVFGENVTLGSGDGSKTNYKIDPSVVSRIYEDWVIPLTKDVEVEYLLRRLE